MSDPVEELARRLIAALDKASGGAGRGFQGPPSISTLLNVQDRQTGKIVPIQYDRENQGIALAGAFDMDVGTLPVLTWLFNGGTRKLASGTLPAADTQLWAPVGESYHDVSVIISNNDNANRTFQLYHGTKADSHLIYTKNYTLVAGDPPVIIHGLGILSGEEFRGECDSADKVSYAFFGTPRTANA